LAIDYGAEVVVLTTFLAASSSLFSTMFFRYLWKKERPGLLYAVNGTLMGLIVITPLAGFVSPGSAIVLGIMAGPLFLAGESLFSRLKWFTDPVGLFAGHALGGLFGTTMVPFLTQKAFATASGFPTLPDGLLFGGGYSAVNLLGLQTLAIATVMPVVFLLSFFSAWALSRVTHGITTDYGKERIE
jgi:Amt family ammonium transporter